MNTRHHWSRRSWLAAVTLATAAAVAGTLPAAGAAPRVTPTDSTAAVPPTPRVVSAETLANGPRYATNKDGTVYSPLDEPAFVLGHDGGVSTLYDNGRGLKFSFWSFGDTFVRNGGLLSNTGAMTRDLNMSDSVSQWDYYGGNAPPGPQQFIPLTAQEKAYNEAHADTDPTTPGCQPGPGIPADQCGEEYAIWGGSPVVADPRHRRILAFYGVVLRSGAVFQGVGTGVAVWTEGDGWSAQGFRRAVIAHPSDPTQPTLLWSQADAPAHFDTAAVVRGGFLYAYGCYLGSVLRHDCTLARVPMQPADAVWDRHAWRFYAGTARDRSACPDIWSVQLSCASPIPAAGSPGTMTGGAAGSSVFWVPALHEYMTVYGVPLSDEIDYSVAYRPEGPWSEPAKLAEGLPAAGEGLGSIDYADFAHPEYAERGGLVQYVTYAHVTGTFTSDFPVVKVTLAPPNGS